MAAGSPLSYDNIMYSLHFYAGTHKADLRNKAKKAINAGLALFVTEWGTTDASGNGNVDTVYEVDYADINGSSGYKALTSAVKGTFKEAGTKSYIRITFSSDAGTLAAGDTVQIQGRIHSESWGMYTQSNDASFLSDAQDYTLKNACRLVVK